MKLCMVGLGSIGVRHLKNIIQVLRERGINYHIDAFRSSYREIDISVAKSIETIYYRKEDIPNDYDVIFVTNPTSLHYLTIKELLPKTKNMFIANC